MSAAKHEPELVDAQDWKPVARFLGRCGCVSIGAVYVLIGVWALLALFRIADPAADEERILARLASVPFGGVLTVAVAVGTAGYVVWLLYAAAFDPYHLGKTAKGVARRIGLGFSAVAYTAIVSNAVRILAQRGGRGSDGGHKERTQQWLVGHVLEWPGGRWLIAALGLAIAVGGLYQLKRVHDGQWRRRVRLQRRSRATRALVTSLAWAGFGARAAILTVLGSFLVRAAWWFDPHEVGDTDSAFDFLGLGGGALGHALFITVAAGTIAYGAFMFANGAYLDRGEPRETASPRASHARKHDEAAALRRA